MCRGLTLLRERNVVALCDRREVFPNCASHRARDGRERENSAPGSSRSCAQFSRVIVLSSLFVLTEGSTSEKGGKRRREKERARQGVCKVKRRDAGTLVRVANFKSARGGSNASISRHDLSSHDFSPDSGRARADNSIRSAEAERTRARDRRDRTER